MLELIEDGNPVYLPWLLAFWTRPLIDAGAEIDMQDCHQRTALHYCAYYNRPASAQLLIDAGAETDIEDRDGNTPAQLYFKRHLLKLGHADILNPTGD